MCGPHIHQSFTHQSFVRASFIKVFPIKLCSVTMVRSYYPLTTFLPVVLTALHFNT